MRATIAALFAALALAGCALTPQTAHLAPSVAVSEENVGLGNRVVVSVIDKRDSRALGNRGTTWGAGAAIASDQDLLSVVREQMLTGLRAKGFDPSEEESAAATDARLRVELRAFRYSTAPRTLTASRRHQPRAATSSCSTPRSEIS